MVSVGGIVSVGGGGGTGGGSTSGITSINGQTGPPIQIKGVNGVDVSTPSSNCILVDAASLSGTIAVSKFAAAFVGLTSGVINHGLGSVDVIVQVRDAGVAGVRPPAEIIPDKIVFDDPDNISLVFNVPQTGRVVVLG